MSMSKGRPITSTAEREKIFQFKITLKYSKPPIWRRIQVPGKYSFRQLHKAIQAAMGWKSLNCDYHLHKFSLSNSSDNIGVAAPGNRQFDFMDLNGKEHFIYQYFSVDNAAGTKKALYEYDFGDCWDHVILLEAVTDPSPGQTYPKVLTGKGACPPEDVGGIGGYYEFLDVLKDPKHPEHEERKDWARNQGFDVDGNPAIFDSSKVKFHGESESENEADGE